LAGGTCTRGKRVIVRVLRNRVNHIARTAARRHVTWIAGTLAATSGFADANGAPKDPRHSISELTATAKLHVGKTADWVAISDAAVWVGVTGPAGVVAIDSQTNEIAATVPLPGHACAGLALGFGALWVPLCAKPNALARVDLRTHAVRLVPGAGPADREGGITTSSDSVWLVVDGRATLARVDPGTLEIRQRIRVPAGSLNPIYGGGRIWVTRSTGREVTVVDAGTGDIVATVPSGPKPRFLTASADSVWTLNQGDGTLTRIDMQSHRATARIPLHTPGHGGDIKFGRDIVWTSMAKIPLSAIDAHTGVVLCQWTGPGGDALGVGDDAIWLTDYDAGDIYRFDLADVVRKCAS
jgi:virginiamycin B lyase